MDELRYHQHPGGGSYIWTQLGSNVDASHQIDSVTASFEPNYVYTYNGASFTRVQRGYQVTEDISGRINSSLTAADLVLSQYQQNQINARGLFVSEWTGLFGYNRSGDPSVLDVVEHGGANVALRNFIVSDAYGNYQEYTYPGGIGVGIAAAAVGSTAQTEFEYDVTWTGDFLSGTLSSNFVAPGVATSVSPVPEPASMILLGTGAILVLRRGPKHQ